MPYPYYYPYYQPSTNYADPLRQQQYQQPMQQVPMQQMPMQQAQQPVNAQSGINWVQGEEGAKGFIVAPGATVLLMDSESQAFYIKSVDANGMPLPLKVYEYQERSLARQANSTQTGQQIEYATKEELNALAARIDALSAKNSTRAKKTVAEDDDNA